MKFGKISDGFTNKHVSIFQREIEGRSKREVIIIILEGEVRVSLEDVNYGTKKVFAMVKDDLIFIDPRTIYEIKFVKKSKVIKIENE